MEQRQRASPEQFSILIDFMESHGDLSRPQSGPQGRMKSNQLWQQLAVMLNSLGNGVNKTPDKWKKVWLDWKTKTKKKYLNQRIQASSTGGGPNKKIFLTALEERVVAVIGASAVVGQTSIQEIGFHPGNARMEPPLNDFNMMEDHSSQNIVIQASTINMISEPETFIGPPPPSSLQSPQRPPSSPPRPPTPPPPPPLSCTPQGRNRRHQVSASPYSRSLTSRRALLRARRNRGLTPFERVAELFNATERRRLEQEEARDQRLHEREMERLILTRQQNDLLQQLLLVLSDRTQQRPGSLPSTGG